jgi:copper resistance protein D
VTADVDRTLLAWPLAASLIAIFGTAGFLLFLADKRLFDIHVAAASLLLLWRILAAVVLPASVLMLLNITADMGGVSWTSAMALVPEVLTETHAGHVFELFLPVALALLLFASVPLPQAARTLGLFLSAGVLLFLMALMSHAIDKGSIAVAIYFLHEIAAGFWVGSLLALWMVERYGDPPDAWVRHAARRVSTVALWSVIALVITGLYTAYNGLGLDMYRLLFSAYGRTLITKVVVFLGVLAIGAHNRYWLMPDVDDPATRDTLLRNVRVESVILLLVVVGLATLLANTPPAHGMPDHAGHSMMAGDYGRQE